MHKLQTLKNKKGEVSFRQKLYQQLLEGHEGLTSTIEGTKIHQLNARQSFQKLQKSGITLSPYLDLGAASCARSLILENEFGAKGIAGDLSFETLQFAPILAKGLGYKKLPLRIVFDIYHLPFRDNSLPFIFTFQTLHHLPDPGPVFEEIKRVLPDGGYFYFGEEPIKQTLNLGLWRRGSQRNPLEKFLMALCILPFITRIGRDEVEHGILEESFSLGNWQDFLKAFDEIRVEILPFKLGPKSEQLNPPLLTKIAIFLLGGGINALCKVSKKTKAVKFKNLLEVLACPQCSTHPPLISQKIYFYCPRCEHKYKIKNDIIFLLPKSLEKELYGSI